MSAPVLPTVRLPAVNGNEYVTPEGKLVGLSSSKFSVSWPEEHLARHASAPAGKLPVEPANEEEEMLDVEIGDDDGPKPQPQVAEAPSAQSSTDSLQPSHSPGPPRFSRALSLPLPSQLGYLRNPHRSDVLSPRQDEPASPDSLRLQELSVELADSVQMMIQTMLHISPPQILDPAKEQFSACSLSVPASSISAMLTTMKNLNYISEHMSGLCTPSKTGDMSPQGPPPELNVVTEFDIGEMLQSVGDSLGGAAALAGVDLVLYHGDDIGLRHVTVQGDENGMSYVLSHMVRQILITAKPGDSVELGLLIEPTDAKIPEEVDIDHSISCVIRISHKFNGETPEEGKALPSRPQPNFTSLLLRRLLHQLSATITTELPLPKSITYGRTCELSLTLNAGVSPSGTSAATTTDEEDPVTGEPSVEQLIAFAETLKGKRVALYADEKGSFAQHLTSYLTAWGMDVTHVSPTGEVDGLSESVFGQQSLAPTLSTTGSGPQAPAVKDKTPPSSPPTFVFIDDNINVLRERLRLLRSEQASMGAALRKRPSLAAHHRPKSSPQVARAMGTQINAPLPNAPNPVIVHFTSLGNYKLVKDVVQSVIAFHVNSGLPVPEIMIIPKPAGPRRFLATLHTAVTRPVVDPIFSPIATTPNSPNVHSGGYFFQNHNATMESSSDSPRAPGRGLRPHGSRSNSDRSAKSAKDISELYNNRPPSPSPLALSDTAEYFAEAVAKLGASPSSGLVIQSPDGQPAGIFFHPKRSSSGTPSAQNMERDNGHLQVSTEPTTRRRSSSRLSISSTSPSTLSFSSLHTVSQSPTSATSPVEAVRMSSPPTRGIGSPNSIRKSPRMNSIDETSDATPSPSREGSGGTVGSTTPGPRRSATSTPQADRRNTPPASPKAEPVVGTPSLRRGTNSRRGTADGGAGSPGATGTPVKKKAKQADNSIVPPISVLIVDDNPINQTILSTFMRKKKIKYEVANNGQEAVEKWKTGEFHLILMDIQMPVMDGIQATKEIRRMEAQNAASGYPPSDLHTSRTPSEASNDTKSASTPYRSSVIIVALTASSLQSDRVAALAAGCNDFLTKPVSLLWLNNKIIEWGSIKALQMWADLRPDALAVGAEQARSVAERLHVPAKGRRTPSPHRKNSVSSVTPAATAPMTPSSNGGATWPNLEVTSSPHSGRSLEELAQDLAQEHVGSTDLVLRDILTVLSVVNPSPSFLPSSSATSCSPRRAMNTITEAGRKTSINSLLNPEASSSALNSGLTHLANASLNTVAANHQVQASSQSAGLYEAQHYSSQTTTTGGSFNLRAADWSVSDDRHELGSANGIPRYQPPPGSYNKDQNPDCSSPPTTTSVPRPPPPLPYAHTQSWPPPMPTAAIPYGFQMYSQPSEGVGLSGDYQRHATSPYAAAYTGEDSPTLSERLQTSDRGSVQPAARETANQPAIYPAAIVYAPFLLSPHPTQPSKPPEPPQPQQPLKKPPFVKGVRMITPAMMSKRPASEEADGSKSKKSKANGSKSTPQIQAPSKRGYNAKKRSEAAQIAAQNAAAMIPNVSYTALTDGKGKQKADSRMQIVPTDQAGAVKSSIGLLSPELQFARCMSNRYKNDHFPRCVSCTRRWAGDTCRFQGIRFFLKNANQDLVGVSFLEAQKEDGPNMEFPNFWNVRLEARHINRTKKTIAQALLPTLQKEKKHSSLADVIHRHRESDVRATCDTCMTSIFSSSWMCRLCGREACAECYATVCDLTSEKPDANPTEVVALQAKRERHAHANPFFLSCTRRNEHAAKDFSPVSRFCDSELSNAIKGMEQVMGVRKKVVVEANKEVVGTSKEGSQESSKEASQEGSNEGSGDKEAEPQQQPMDQDADKPLEEPMQVDTPIVAPTSTDPTDIPLPESATTSLPNVEATSPPVPETVVPVPQLIEGDIYKPKGLSELTESIPSHVIPRYRDEDLTEDSFPLLWADGRPLVVEGVAKKFKLLWTPDYFKEKHGADSCLIIECQSEVNKRITVGEFFDKFGNYEKRKECWKLKDWPTSTDFKSAYPDLYKDFSQAVPVPSYVRRDGVLNIASHFPSNTISPDLGPKMYNAMASTLEAGSRGSTRLHMDMADALNIMTYAESCPDGSEGCAAWDLFRAEDSDKIRKFLIDKFGPTKGKTNNGSAATTNGESGASTVKHSGQEWNGHTDPIHGQQFYLDEELRKELYDKTGVISYRYYQRPGEAVFIPAGCAHQVANLADCIKVAVDFVSPENVERCERLTREFREQNQRKVWKEDVLQLRTMMWFAWLSCCRQEQELAKSS